MLDYTPIAMPTRKALKYTVEERQKWRTPNTPEQPVLQLVATALGGEIGLDPTADDRRSVPAHHHIIALHDCLKRPDLWKLEPWEPPTAFENPPFDAPHLYLEALITQHKSGNLKESVVLMKSGTVHNKKTGSLIRHNASVICHWGAGKVGRIGFIDHEGYQIKGSDFDCVLVYFGKNEDRFNEVFRHWGTITRVMCWDT